MPARYSLDYDIITVGAVFSISSGAGFGTQLRKSHGGNLVTVFAPGQGSCAKDYKYGTSRDFVEGTSIATGYTAGLVAYFLGLPDLGPHLRSFPNIPKAVKKYIQQKAYSRNQNPAKPRPAISGTGLMLMLQRRN